MLKSDKFVIVDSDERVYCRKMHNTDTDIFLWTRHYAEHYDSWADASKICSTLSSNCVVMLADHVNHNDHMRFSKNKVRY